MTQRFEQLQRAAGWIKEADGLLITAGAGMGVDSGLPDFRGEEGFWAAYPALGRAGLSFEDIANPQAFLSDPRRAWGFYGHRLALYRAIVPHHGFTLLRQWADRMPSGAFVFTSNVDGHFGKAGFSDQRIVECHGSIHAMQCVNACSGAVWSAEGFEPDVDEVSCLLQGDLPTCPHCAGLARPHILMFDDVDWHHTSAVQQRWRLEQWIAATRHLVVIEIGAGSALPTVRRFGERYGPRVIRINAREAAIAPHIGTGIAGSAIDVLRELDSFSQERS